ncbi:MAG: MMPL family transporter [Acidobacteriota bacterium]
MPAQRTTLWLVLGTAALLAFTLFFVDLKPRVEGDFFFATDDPQLATAGRIAELFPAGDQVLIRTVGSVENAEHLERIEALSEELAGLAGVTGVRSLSRGPRAPEAVADSPFWSRLLTPGGPGASLLVVSLDSPGSALVTRIEEAVRGFRSEGMEAEISGVPYVVEQVRRALLRDLAVFSSAALLLFAALLGWLFRSLRRLAGTLTACTAACAGTLLILRAAAVPIGLLTANLVTLVFVLTLSHSIFLNARWATLANQGRSPQEAAAEARRSVFGASFWCMITTLLGFLSLLTASAKPLQELGLAGAVGATLAIAAAYLIFPPFLAAAAPPRQAPEGNFARRRIRPRSWLAAAAVIVLCLGLGLGVPRLATDPPLLSYFQQGSPLRDGLEAIDRDGGSSPLSIVVTLPEGSEDPRLDTDLAMARLIAAQQALEKDPAVGSVLSAAPLLAEARLTSPFAALLPPKALLDLLSTDSYERVALSFLTAERERGLFFLRMRESEREEERRAVIDRLTERVRGAELEPILVGGLYDLQAQLSTLVRSSLLRSLLVLFGLFSVIAWAVSRNLRTTLAMAASLPLVPLAVVGAFGWLGLPFDIISSTAPTVALGLGVDSLIHLAAAARRSAMSDAPWIEALRGTGPAILGAALVVATGFTIFLASSFPPTQRFGSAVVLGTLVAAAVALWVLPRLAVPLSSRRRRPTGAR